MSKKVILFIVEGITEEISFALILNKLSTQKNLMGEIINFNIVNGDVTSNNSKKFQQNIKAEIGKIIKSYLIKNHINKNDIKLIVHLTDMDGAYINAENVISDSNNCNIHYDEKNIYTANPQKIIERNSFKSSNLNELSRTSKIMGIDYKIYYFSCNLEHVLHGIQNADESNKSKLANEFENKYKDDLKGFVEFFKSIAEDCEHDYDNTWNFIKENCNSLKRHCNFYLYVIPLL